jgi:hypothetical protein
MVNASADGAEVHRSLWFYEVMANGSDFIAIRITHIGGIEIRVVVWPETGSTFGSALERLGAQVPYH